MSDENENQPDPVNPKVKPDPPTSPAIVKRTQIKAPKGTGASTPKDHEKQLRDLQTKQSELEDRQSSLESAFGEINSLLEVQGAPPGRRRPAPPQEGASELDQDLWGTD